MSHKSKEEQKYFDDLNRELDNVNETIDLFNKRKKAIEYKIAYEGSPESFEFYEKNHGNVYEYVVDMLGVKYINYITLIEPTFDKKIMTRELLFNGDEYAPSLTIYERTTDELTKAKKLSKKQAIKALAIFNSIVNFRNEIKG